MPTLALIKPDAVAKGYAPAIEAIIAEQSFAVLARAEVTLTAAQAAELYEEHEGTPLFAPMCEALTSGPTIALALDKADAQAAWLSLVGPADVATAKAEAPLSLRAIYGADAVRNALHASTSAAAAFKELKFFFPKTFPREVTIALIKPDAAASADAILAEAAGDGFLLLARKELTLTPAQAEAFVGALGAADAAAHVAHLTSGGVVVAALEKSFGIEGWMGLCGPEDAAAARDAAPASLRARYGTDGVKNGVHASASVAAAAAEAAFFFGDALTTVETTFAFVKPDAFGNADAVVAIAEAAGFAVLCSEQVALSAARAGAFYAEHEGKDFYEGLVGFMSSGPALAMVLARPCAIGAWRALCGPTDAAKARAAAPLSLRAQFGTDGRRNATHGSDSAASAAREAAFFFPQLGETQTTLGLVCPHAVAAGAVDGVLAAAAAAGLVVTERLLTTLDAARAADFVDLLGAAAPPAAPPPAAAEPFICAWVEGGKHDKALQLYNPSDEPIALDDYALPLLRNKGNGDGVPTHLGAFPPGKAVPPRGVFVVYHPEASPALKAQLPVDARASMPSELLSNGDDGTALVKLTAGRELVAGAPLPFTVLDYLGDFTGANKGRPWAVAGTPSATKNDTLVRKAHVTAGNAAPWTDPTASSQGTSAPTSEWAVLAKGTLSAPGWSLTGWAAAPPPPPPPPAGSYEALVAELSAGPALVLALSGKGAVARWNAALGPQQPLLAKVRCPGCVRALHGVDATRFAAHGSATAAAAFSELKFFFPTALVDPLPSSKQAKDYVAETLTPTLTAGLIELCKSKPDAPVEWLAKWLLANNPNTPQL